MSKHSVILSDDTISVAVGPTKTPPSAAKLRQLADARKLAIESRREKQKARLEAKLAELSGVMHGISEGALARIATKMMAQEEELRAKQNHLTEALNENLEHMMMEITRIKTILQGNPPRTTPPVHTLQRTQPATHKPALGQGQRSSSPPRQHRSAS